MNKYFKSIYWKGNFPSVRRSFGRSVCDNFLKGQKVSLLSFYRSNFSLMNSCLNIALVVPNGWVVFSLFNWLTGLPRVSLREHTITPHFSER